jgi:hypothetical protein
MDTNKLINIMCEISEVSGRLRVIDHEFCSHKDAKDIAVEALNKGEITGFNIHKIPHFSLVCNSF